MYTDNTPASVAPGLAGLKGGGSIAAELLSNGMNFDRLRANTAYGLRPEEWAYLNEQVVDAARGIMTTVADFTQYGLIKQIDGMSNTYFRFDQVNDLNDAELSMKAGVKGAQDALEFTPNYIPLPFIFKDYSFDIREVNESRKTGNGLDATAARLAGLKVAEKIEELTLTGVTYVVGGKTFYGIVNHTNVNSVTLSTYGNWDASSGDGARILGCVNAMIQASVTDKCYGPWGLYIPPAYASTMNYRAGTYDTRSVGESILALAGFKNDGSGQAGSAIKFIRPNAKLASNTVALVPLDPNQVQLIEGLRIQNIPWTSGDGLTLNNRVMAIYAPFVHVAVGTETGIVKAA